MDTCAFAFAKHKAYVLGYPRAFFHCSWSEKMEETVGELGSLHKFLTSATYATSVCVLDDVDLIVVVTFLPIKNLFFRFLQVLDGKMSGRNNGSGRFGIGVREESAVVAGHDTVGDPVR